ncbi:hypothetical protein IAU60_005442 [Kwoniella sp. DSM 27419]
MSIFNNGIKLDSRPAAHSGRLTGLFLAFLVTAAVFTHVVVVRNGGEHLYKVSSHAMTPAHVQDHITALKQWLPAYGPVDDKWDNLYIPHTDYPETRFVKGVGGFSECLQVATLTRDYFHNLYLSNGVYIVLTSEPEHLPEKGVSAIFSGLADPEDKWHHHLAAGEDRFLIVTPEQAEQRQLFQRSAVRKTGISLMFNDVAEGNYSSFLDHYYHFIGEMFLGLWRVVVSAGETELPRRLIYRANGTDWRDRAGITTWFQQAVLPETTIEEVTVYEDRKKSGMTFIFDKIAIADANADLPLLEVPWTWMDPLRNQLKKLVTAEGQLTGRRLVDTDAKDLLDEMEKLHHDGVIEFHNAVMEKMSRSDQFCLALRGDVMFGVHGNGLSHQLWMRPGAAVMEMMPVGGFARDYAILAEMMHHEYHAVHHNTTFTPDK